MYSENHAIAAKGLHTMFVGEIVAIVAAFLIWIPIIGMVGALAGGIISLVGLYTASAAHPNFKNAMICTIANIVVTFLEGLVKEGALNALLSIASGILSFLVVYFVCTAASEYLAEKGDQYQADRGTLIWKLNLVCYAVVIVCTVLVFVPILNILAALAAVVVGIVSIVAGILYLIFLYKASQSLAA